MDFHEQLAQVAGNEPGTIDQEFKARSRRDPGTPSAAMLALVTIFVLYGLIVGGNMLQATMMSQQAAETPAGEWTAEEREAHFEATRSDPVAAVTRLLVYAKESWQAPDAVYTDRIPDRSEDTLAQAQRVVMLGELVGPERAMEELDMVAQIEAMKPPEQSDENGESPEPAVGEERALAYLRRVYEGSLDEANLSAEMTDAEDYLGWWAKLARLHDAGADDLERAALIEAGRRMFVLVAVIGVGGLLVAAGALASAVVMIVRLAQRRITARFVAPAPGGSVYLEIFAVFLAGFVLVQLAGALVALAAGSDAGIWATLVGQWMLIAVPLWPLLRGVPLSRMRQDLGLHRGEGVLREIGAGIVGYLAGLPIFIGAIVFMIVLQAIIQLATGSEEPVQPNNPILDLVQTQSVALIALTVSLAVLWAPLVEETVFRGALLRHMRGRVGMLAGAILTGLLFAFLHSYGPLFTPPLIALGFTFAMLREWRGSLIAPMTAHFLHNGTLMAVIITAINMVG